ncbi:MFS transporter [Methylobacterium sp. 77]|uniref:MFS transporter n=1 Tax=Methylobacterium sp. 77 TaxID=1101192 RepID=UPI0003623C80|nr:MFS transporter [Methylobacterium sp. 77]
MMLDLSPLRASRGFRLLYAARAASFLAFGVLGVAVSLQMYALTSSSLQVALLNAAVAAPMALALIVGGWLADRYDRRAVMVWSRTAHLLTILILMANAGLDQPMVWPIYAAAVVGGSTFGFGMPAIMAATPALVGREHLSGAAALTAVAAQVGAIAGPFLAGAITAGAGLVACYGTVAVISGITPVVLAFLPALPPIAEQAAGTPVTALAADEDGFMGGLRYIARSPLVLSLLLIDLVALVLAVPYVLLPELATHGLGEGPDSIGLLYAAPSVGALVGALGSGRAGASPFAGRWLVACVAIWACACIALGFSDGMIPALICLAALGAAASLAGILRAALIQRATPDAMLGRVSSLWVLEESIGPALGGMQAGTTAHLASARIAMVAGGGLCLAATAAIAALTPALRGASLAPETKVIADDLALAAVDAR